MKKILLLSDTHNHLDENILSHCRAADEIWHAGDIGSIAIFDQLSSIKKVIAVSGNIDGADVRSTCPEIQQFNCEDLRVLIIHIGGNPTRYSDKAAKLISEHNPGLFICGHSHILKVIRDTKNNLLFMNPGAAGHHGFHHMRTLLRFQVNGAGISNVEVIELGKRGRST